MKVLIIIIGVMLAICMKCEGVVFSRCQLVHQLRKHGFPESKIRDWVCLVEHESGRKTNIISKPNSDGSRDYGLFQINNNYWCSPTKTPGKDCHVTCSDLLTDDITKASTCAKKIYQRHGFDAWYGWKNNCHGKTLPDIKKC